MDEICFACSRVLKTKDQAAFHEKRAKCTKRGSHKPQGDFLIHDGYYMKQCADCSTLVIPV